MKKLKLKLDGIKNMLTREQMQKISGAYGFVWLCYDREGLESFIEADTCCQAQAIVDADFSTYGYTNCGCGICDD
jgi:hypothetical protein